MHRKALRRIDTIIPRSAIHLPLPEHLLPIISPIKLHRLRQFHLPKLLRILRPHRPRSHYRHIPIDQLLLTYQTRRLISLRARLITKSTRVAIDVVVPAIGARMVVEFTHFDRILPAEVFFQLPLFRELVAEVGQVERLDLGGDVVEDGRVGGLGRGAEDEAV